MIVSVGHPVKADIYFDGKYWCARCLDFDVFTQGKTLDELVKHLKEAVALPLGPHSRQFQPTIVSLMEVAVA
ncbi:MAG: hypothetical protein A3C53_06225 [Omnitrophica WOR_2 bacterium RIFCSPHIGHO2_02_FULL_68_15]|nr:MAG: hypothetical protein A3C53_06225 [Omnitrophica WOR_2 bacterium RIFCSPHIGHO2_02_FULL_68_15]